MDQEETCSESEPAFAYSGLGGRQGPGTLSPMRGCWSYSILYRPDQVSPFQSHQAGDIGTASDQSHGHGWWWHTDLGLMTGIIEKWSSGRACWSVCLGGFVWIGSLDLQGLWCKGACTETVETHEVSNFKIVCMVSTELVFGSWAQQGRWHRATPCNGTVEGTA